MSREPAQSRLMADVSDYQANVNLRRYVHGGRRAIMLKAGEGAGNAGATCYPARADAAHALGLVVVHYLFVHPEDPESVDVRAFAERVHPHWHRGDWLCFDIEIGEPARAAAWLRGAQHDLRSLNAPTATIGYTYAAYMAQGGRALAEAVGWWIIADYDGRLLGRGEPKLPRGSRSALLGKQYTDGAIGAQPHAAPGIGPCDDTILTLAGQRRLLGGKPPALAHKHLGRPC